MRFYIFFFNINTVTKLKFINSNILNNIYIFKIYLLFMFKFIVILFSLNKNNYYIDFIKSRSIMLNTIVHNF